MVLDPFVSFRFEKETYDKWTAQVDEIVKINLEKPLLVRDQDSLLLTMNFDPKVCFSLFCLLSLDCSNLPLFPCLTLTPPFPLSLLLSLHLVALEVSGSLPFTLSSSLL